MARDWLAKLPAHYALRIDTLRPASDDASFRRYFRIDSGDPSQRSLILMDAPPPMEDTATFARVAELFLAAGVTVPHVLERDTERGLLLLTDFGSDTYLERLDDASAPSLYRDALASLVTLQNASRPSVLPDYDRALLLRELSLYPDWYVARHRQVALSEADRQVLADAFELILRNNLAQPRVYVHRDYHSRNLMVLQTDRNPGVLDFQDAVYGPITYDLVSLLRDAYVCWDEERVLDWAIRYWEAARAASLPVNPDFGEFYRDFEWMGLQRHLKVLGIFARLNYRDGKPRYLQDMPRVLDYVLAVAGRYGAFTPLARLIDRIEARDVQVGLTF
ncbi:MAG TPA: phosphotransferase [Burkholderiaceae bacterium]|nr:phosphotransferase [Burkholderiaceae bacterium]